MEKENVTSDYSCGNCGWWGWAEECEWGEYEGVYCPKCGSDQTGEITIEDFEYGNALHGKLWHGREILKT